MCTATPCWPCVLRRLAALGEEALSLGLTPFHRRFLQLLDWVPFRLSVLLPPRRFGRPRLDRVPLLRAFFAKALGNLPTTQALRERLQADPLLRRCCGWETLRELPSAAPFSRAFAQFAQEGILDKVHAELVRAQLADLLVWHVSRDSTAVPARERAHKPAPPAPASASAAAAPRQRGRPRRDAPPGTPKLTRLQRQAAANATETAALLAELPHQCDIGVKKNAQGSVERWRGYKLHVATGDDGIPLTCFTPAASLQDSQVAIPLARQTAARVTSLYDWMDTAYDAKEIRQVSQELGHVPIIPHNPGRRGKAAQIPLEADRARRYQRRSGAERFNALLKDHYGGRTVRGRGRAKVHAHLMLGVVVIFVAILQGWADP